jgi:peroxiredoxin
MITPLLVGMQVPEVTLKSPEGTDVAFKEVLTGKPTVLIFYRGSW